MNTQARYPKTDKQGVHKHGISPKGKEQVFFEFCGVRINFRHLRQGRTRSMKHRRGEKTAQA